MEQARRQGKGIKFLAESVIGGSVGFLSYSIAHNFWIGLALAIALMMLIDHALLDDKMPRRRTHEPKEVRRILEFPPEELNRHIEVLRLLAAHAPRGAFSKSLIDCSLSRAAKVREPELFDYVYGEKSNEIDVAEYQAYLRKRGGRAAETRSRELI